MEHVIEDDPLALVDAAVGGDHRCREPGHAQPHRRVAHRVEQAVDQLQVGQPLKFTNSDQTLHNVHGMPKVNAPWNFAMPKFVKQKENKDLTKPEVMIHVKCDVHPWMSGYVGVLEHPFFAVTGKDGSFTIEGLPPGEYTVEAWQEKLGAQTAKVKVDAGAAAKQDFTFKPS